MAHNNILDILNIRNFLGRTQYKKPLYKGSESFLIHFVENSVQYISCLKNKENVNILLTGRKTGFLGLLICLQSIQNLFSDLVKTDII